MAFQLPDFGALIDQSVASVQTALTQDLAPSGGSNDPTLELAPLPDALYPQQRSLGLTPFEQSSAAGAIAGLAVVAGGVLLGASLLTVGAAAVLVGGIVFLLSYFLSFDPPIPDELRLAWNNLPEPVKATVRIVFVSVFVYMVAAWALAGWTPERSLRFLMGGRR